MILTPFDIALFMILFAVGIIDSSINDPPIALPFASKKVKAIPPLIMMLSALSKN